MNKNIILQCWHTENTGVWLVLIEFRDAVSSDKFFYCSSLRNHLLQKSRACFLSSDIHASQKKKHLEKEMKFLKLNSITSRLYESFHLGTIHSMYSLHLHVDFSSDIYALKSVHMGALAESK